MSTEVEATGARKEHRSHKRSDKEEKKRSKKRRREEQEDNPQALQDSQASPTKKRRTDLPPEAQAVIRGHAPSSNLDESPFAVRTSSLYLPLSPISQSYPLDGICAEHLSPLILTYYPPLKGVILSYDNVRLSESPDGAMDDEPVLATSKDEYGASYVWVTAEFTLLQPRRGAIIDAWINLQSESHLGLVCWNLFNASIERKRLPKDWRWVEGGSTSKFGRRASETSSQGQTEEEEGYYVNGEGKKVDGVIKFRVQDFESFSAAGRDRDKGFISIEGTLLSKDEEKELRRQGRQRKAQGKPT